MASPATETSGAESLPHIPSDALTINEAAETTGWSARMLRYIESVGLVVPPRSGGGYRLYGPGELQRLRTLRELLKNNGLEIADVGFVQRLRDEPEVDGAVSAWLDQPVQKPAEVPAGDWLTFEQQKHQQLLKSIQQHDS
jgi:DNA-binding transcriptional MerR regulator